MGMTGIFWFSRKQDERNRYYHGFGYCSVYCKINDKIYRYTEWQTNPLFKSNFNDAICLGYGTCLGTKVEFDYENSDVIENPDMIKRGNDMNQSEAKIGMKIRIVDKDNVWGTPVGTILTVDHNEPSGGLVMSDGHYYLPERYDYYLPERYEPAYNFAIGDEVEVINWSTTYDGKRGVIKEIDCDGVILENYGWFPLDSVKKVEEKKVVFKPGDRVKITGKYKVSPWIDCIMNKLIGTVGEIQCTENETLELSDIPTRVLMEIRDKYTKILDNGIDNWNRIDDWSSANCAMCRYMGRDAHEITKCKRCPLIVDDWCEYGHGITSKLNPDNKRDEWAGNIAEFLCKINKEIARR